MYTSFIHEASGHVHNRNTKAVSLTVLLLCQCSCQCANSKHFQFMFFIASILHICILTESQNTIKTFRQAKEPVFVEFVESVSFLFLLEACFVVDTWRGSSSSKLCSNIRV